MEVVVFKPGSQSNRKYLVFVEAVSKFGFGLGLVTRTPDTKTMDTRKLGTRKSDTRTPSSKLPKSTL